MRQAAQQPIPRCFEGSGSIDRPKAPNPPPPPLLESRIAPFPSTQPGGYLMILECMPCPRSLQHPADRRRLDSTPSSTPADRHETRPSRRHPRGCADAAAPSWCPPGAGKSNAPSEQRAIRATRHLHVGGDALKSMSHLHEATHYMRGECSHERKINTRREQS